MRTLFADFISLLFPNYCQSCNAGLSKGESVICTNCWLELPRTNYHLHHDNELKKRFAGRVTIDRAFGFVHFVKTGRIQKLLHALKYKNMPAVGLHIGRRYGTEIRPSINAPFDVVIPIPLHKKKLKKRGYNQSDSFAIGLAEALETSFELNALVRQINNETQTKKSREERWKNVAHAFKVNEIALIKDKNILLVDDVITTGATLEACVDVLLPYASSVSIATIAVA